MSWVRQHPAPPAKVSLWAYHVSDPVRTDKIKDGNTLTMKRGGLSHHWTTGITSLNKNTSYEQTKCIFEKYNTILQRRGMSLADNVIRTWLFVQNIDANYHGMTEARKEFFAKHGLTQDTHFIASTGVEGDYINPAAMVTMDAYAISGIRQEQIKFLSAPDHLSPTYLYGVTFERATSIDYKDRKHIFISGTASIDRKGEILHPGDVSRQLERTLENTEALLKQAGATFKDMCVFIVYVRDPSDYIAAQQMMRKRFSDAPIDVVLARVCRPGWLIEVEGMAIIPVSRS